jgi:hypothetical protein
MYMNRTKCCIVIDRHRYVDTAGGAHCYMKSIYGCTLRNVKHLLEARELLWNHVDYALDSWLTLAEKYLIPGPY